MDIQTRKDKLIEFISNIEDEKELDRFEMLMVIENAEKASEEKIRPIAPDLKSTPGKTTKSDEMWARFNRQFGDQA